MSYLTEQKDKSTQRGKQGDRLKKCLENINLFTLLFSWRLLQNMCYRLLLLLLLLLFCQLGKKDGVELKCI